MSLFTKAVGYASLAHGDVPDGAGQPYILHPMRVAVTVERFAEELDLTSQIDLLRALAMLHDVVEDTPSTIRHVEFAVGLPAEGVAALERLTHLPNEPYEEYLERAIVNPLAAVVKAADVQDNGDPIRLARLAEIDARRAKRLRRKYDDAAGRIREAWKIEPWWWDWS